MTTTPFSDVHGNSGSAAVWTGRLLSGTAIVFLAMDTVIHLLRLPVAVQGTEKVGYPGQIVLGLGIIELVCLAAYLIPRTRVFGAILWTGYLGGAVATHVRIGDPLFSHVLAPVYVAAFLWTGLCLRDARLRAVVMGRG